MTEEATAPATVVKRYPIVDSVSLSRPQRSGLLGLRKPSRSPAEMLRPGEGHHVLVYRVDGEYVLDDASLDSRHDIVVRASHVTVVDTQRNAPIIVQLSIPARQAGFPQGATNLWCSRIRSARAELLGRGRAGNGPGIMLSRTR
jgi:hypothetical protein